MEVFVKKNDVFPVLIGMEKKDGLACNDMAKRIDKNSAVFVSGEYDIHEIASIIKYSSMLISSRYHAIVISMSSLIPSAGISMDERIENLMNERGDSDLCVTVDEEDLSRKISIMLNKLSNNKQVIQHHVSINLSRQLKQMDEMAIWFSDELYKFYPEYIKRSIL